MIVNMLKAKNVREWYAFFGGEESGIPLEQVSKIWDAAVASVKTRPVTVFDMVHEKLLEMGADGLCNDNGCACDIACLASCNSIEADCEASRKVKCEPKEGCCCDDPVEWCYRPIGIEE